MKREMKELLLFVIAVAVLAPGLGFAEDVRRQPTVDTPSEGFVAVESVYGMDETASRLVDMLEGNPNITVLGVVDHAAGGATVDLDLLPTKVIFFGNPALGTPLMQKSRSVGLDLPQKLLIWQADDGKAYVGYNAPAYLAARHSLPAGLGQLSRIDRALARFASSVAKAEDGERESLIDAAANSLSGHAFSAGVGLVSVVSSVDFETTVSNLERVLAERGFRIPFVVPHSKAAASNDLELGPTTLFVFGNPKVGTPLMQHERRIGVDLPQKMLVWEDGDGTVRLVYNDPSYILGRHGVTGLRDRSSTIERALNGIARAAAER